MVSAHFGVVAGFDSLGLKPGDHLVTVLQNRFEAATLHWACQFAGLVITPVNWRSTALELDFFLENAEAKAVAYEDASAAAVAASVEAQKITRIALDAAQPSDIAFAALASRDAPDALPRADARCLVGDALHVRHHGEAERRAAPPAAPNAPQRSPMSRRIFTRMASVRSASCRSITPWACARCSPCR